MSHFFHCLIWLACISCALLTSDITYADPRTSDSDAEAELVRLREENQRLREWITELVQTNARLKRLLDSPPIEVSELEPPPSTVDGVITMVRKQFAEISIGADDGLKVGHKLKIVRDGMDAGSVVVRRVDPDRAIVEAVDRDDALQSGDRIVTYPKSSTHDE